MSAATCRAELCLSVLKETVPLIVGEKQPEGYGWLDFNKTSSHRPVRRNVWFITDFRAGFRENICVLHTPWGIFTIFRPCKRNASLVAYKTWFGTGCLTLVNTIAGTYSHFEFDQTHHLINVTFQCHRFVLWVT